MWIETGASRLPEGFESKIAQHKLSRVDRSDTVWFNLDTGASLVLLCVGGWNTATDSYFKLIHATPNGELFDLTFAILGESKVKFDVSDGKHAGDTFKWVQADAAIAVTDRIGAQRLWEKPAPKAESPL